MKTQFALVVGFIASLGSVFAQTKLTFYEHIQPIIAKNCTGCHRPGGIGPFSLQTYPEVAKRSEFVAKVTQIRYMPPLSLPTALFSIMPTNADLLMKKLR